LRPGQDLDKWAEVQLNPIEEAYAYQHLIDKFGITQEKISETVGKSRASVANSLRLLNLPREIQEEITKGRYDEVEAKISQSFLCWYSMFVASPCHIPFLFVSFELHAIIDSSWSPCFRT
jgi:hypothetical protein